MRAILPIQFPQRHSDVDTTEWLQLVGIILASGGALGYAYAWTRRRVRRFARLWGFIGTLVEELGEKPAAVLLGIIRDIEATHGELELRQRLLERHLSLGVFVSRPDGTCSWASEPLCQSFNLDSREIKNWGWLRRIDEADRIRVRDHWVRCVEDDIPYADTYTVCPENADPWICHAEAWPVRNNKHETVCFVGYCRKEEEPGDEG